MHRSLVVFALLAAALAMPVDNIKVDSDMEIPNPTEDEIRAEFANYPRPEANLIHNQGNSSDNKTIIWGPQCSTVPVLGDTCVSIYDVLSNLTLGFELQVHNMTFDENIVHGNETCLDDASLIKLVALIPALTPYKPLIDKIAAVIGFIPGSVLSVCLDINNFDLDQTQRTVSGCGDLKTTLVCWKGKCLYKGDDDLGCFQRHF